MQRVMTVHRFDSAFMFEIEQVNFNESYLIKQGCFSSLLFPLSSCAMPSSLARTSGAFAGMFPSTLCSSDVTDANLYEIYRTTISRTKMNSRFFARERERYFVRWLHRLFRCYGQSPSVALFAD